MSVGNDIRILLMVFTCDICGSEFEADELPRRGSICFRCHIKTVDIGFTHGKDNFHGPTIGERQRKQVADAKAAGIDAQPVGSRWV